MSSITGFFVRNSVTLRIENELITYNEVSKSPPFQFTGCKRGAYGRARRPILAEQRPAVIERNASALFVPDPETSLLD